MMVDEDTLTKLEKINDFVRETWPDIVHGNNVRSAAAMAEMIAVLTAIIAGLVHDVMPRVIDRVDLASCTGEQVNIMLKKALAIVMNKSEVGTRQ